MTPTAPLGLRRAVGLADYTTWRVGGEAQWFAEPENREQLQALLAWAHQEQLPWGVIGAGSNLLISDQGLPGLTLCNRRLQGLVLASGVLIGWIMVTLGVVFTALWWTALHLGRKAEAAQAPKPKAEAKASKAKVAQAPKAKTAAAKPKPAKAKAE